MQELAHAQTTRGGNAVFFDFLGVFLICYPEWVSVSINVVVVAASIWTTVSNVKNCGKYGEVLWF